MRRSAVEVKKFQSKYKSQGSAMNCQKNEKKFKDWGAKINPPFKEGGVKKQFISGLPGQKSEKGKIWP